MGRVRSRAWPSARRDPTAVRRWSSRLARTGTPTVGWFHVPHQCYDPALLSIPFRRRLTCKNHPPEGATAGSNVLPRAPARLSPATSARLTDALRRAARERDRPLDPLASLRTQLSSSDPYIRATHQFPDGHFVIICQFTEQSRAGLERGRAEPSGPSARLVRALRHETQVRLELGNF
jgi:hypothetical protein